VPAGFFGDRVVGCIFLRRSPSPACCPRIKHAGFGSDRVIMLLGLLILTAAR